MRFDPTVAAIRFGCGLSPKLAAPQAAHEMLDALRGPDQMAKEFPVEGFEVFHVLARKMRVARRSETQAETPAVQTAAKAERRAHQREMVGIAATGLRNTLLRRALTPDGFRERLTYFWADHFTAVGKGPLRFSYFSYVEDAIRPHVSGRFAEMLKAVVTHPVMLIYLDQARSVGPNSRAAQTSARVRGLNENLAREVMELHTLGVDGPYGQDDVRALAMLLTGLWYSPKNGFAFRPRAAEPGAVQLLGQRYGGGVPSLRDIHDAMEDLARHPATARHLAAKLAVHFLGDAPAPEVIDAMAARYLETDGDLWQVYAMLLGHPAAWDPAPGNVKPPIDFVGSSLRALDIVPRHISDDVRKLRRTVLEPMSLMGQSWGRPLGPDGWPEEDAAWITPPRMAARLQWGMTVPFLLKRLLPDPRAFVETALGARAPEAVRFAARAAETRAEGVGLVLASPAFHRM